MKEVLVCVSFTCSIHNSPEAIEPSSELSIEHKQKENLLTRSATPRNATTFERRDYPSTISQNAKIK